MTKNCTISIVNYLRIVKLGLWMATPMIEAAAAKKIGLDLKPVIIANTLVIPYPVYGRASDLKPNHCERKGV